MKEPCSVDWASRGAEDLARTPRGRFTPRINDIPTPPVAYNLEMTSPSISLIVLYCSDPVACREFYNTLGLTFQYERHGGGPEHYAAILNDGAVFEIYPAGSREKTGRIRLGLTVDRDAVSPSLRTGKHVFRDPEGRTVELRTI